MNILKGDKALLRTGSSRVVHTDTSSIAIESTGLAPNGDPIVFRVSFSHGEVAMMAKASRVAQSAKKYVAQVGGSAFSRGPTAYFDTVTEARAWAETYGETADWCEIYLRSGRLVGNHRRGTGGRWFRATVGD